jgi:hypothetical protein
MQPTPLAIYSPIVSPHVSDVSDLSSSFIMDMRIGSMLLSKAQNPTKGSVVNTVVSTICHLVDIICGMII